jgi:hypothetical protein
MQQYEKMRDLEATVITVSPRRTVSSDDHVARDCLRHTERERASHEPIENNATTSCSARS